MNKLKITKRLSEFDQFDTKDFLESFSSPKEAWEKSKKGYWMLWFIENQKSPDKDLILKIKQKFREQVKLAPFCTGKIDPDDGNSYATYQSFVKSNALEFAREQEEKANVIRTLVENPF